MIASRIAIVVVPAKAAPTINLAALSTPVIKSGASKIIRFASAMLLTSCPRMFKSNCGAQCDEVAYSGRPRTPLVPMLVSA